MIARNMNELDRMLKKELRKAMTITMKKVLADMYEQTGDFYAGGKPIPAEKGGYVRTGALGDTPTTTELNVNGNEMSFEAFLNTQHQYTTGKNPTMLQVLLLANDIMTKQPDIYLKEAKGSPHFWDRALKQMEKTYNDVLSNFFTKS